jgi:hypothetical protein
MQQEAWEQQMREGADGDEAHEWERDDQATADLIELGSDKIAHLHIIGTWTDEQCRAAEAWASARHFKASDNDVGVPSVPAHVADLPDATGGLRPW